MMQWLKRKIYGINTLNELEILVLGSIQNQLSSDAKDIWDKQISKINKVQRLPEGVESDFYSIDLKNGKATFDETLKFPNKTEDLLLATVTLKFENESIDIDVYCVKGRVFCLNFRGSSSYWIELFGMLDEYTNKIETKCTIKADLMEEIS